jgi:integrase/recombinase XerD
MSALSHALRDYLALRRALGTELRGPASHLKRFVEFAEREGDEVVTTDLVLRWVQIFQNDGHAASHCTASG